MSWLLKLPVFLLLWVLFIAIKIPVILLGLVMVPLLYRYRKEAFDDVPGIFLPWQNPEDWNDGPKGTEHSLPQWWINREGSGFKSWFHYHAIRNPANGLRNIEWLDLDLDQSKVDYVTPHYLKYYEPWHEPARKRGIYGYLAWQGWKAGFKFEHIWNDEKYLSIKLGWRVEPRDAVVGPDPDGQRARDGAGFATKFLPYRDY